ncbi:DUF2213 domain-containing protein [Sphingobium sp. WCS2017Hpa-17]|uniref:DUF2213 domain-containing protein n=1 Tax=Sphingobium sp. WCS2017Hpa-17 TaxID=3073638 RepID=UPI00288A30A2|nr:DUF2213 domain-containing protein [Sphingobium sp. WCS2017Hpa-17]
MTTVLLALDRASVRSRDANGFLHVAMSNISKANVCPYYGQEIPGWQELGLDGDRVYYLYRDPDELARGAATFNNVPILSRHMPVDCEALPEELIIGSTGTDCAFDGVYLKNSLVVWCADHQRAIEDEEKRELSCGYRYRADMTAGRTLDGLQYDGVMRDIMGNHVALVIEGRAGPDVMVGDEVMKLKSRTALMISGALQAHIRPLLAADAKIDIAPALDGIDAKAMAADGAPKKLANKIVKLVGDKLAADKAIDADALAGVIGTVTPLALDEDKIEEAEDEDPEAAEDEDPDAEDEDDPKDAEDEDPKEAMDASTVRRMISDAEKRGASRAAAIDTAKRDVAPHVGEVVGMDSAEAIYRFCLTENGYGAASLKGAPIHTLQAMVAGIKKGQPIAQDRKVVTGASKLAAVIPNLPPLIRS